ncbi:MAG: hypothetical protein AAFX40_13565 [Cyanobacteria bacterium J06639_1]
MSAGIIYIASGSKYVKEACQSAASVKQHMPDVPITLFADEAMDCPHIEEAIVLDAEQMQAGGKILKVVCMEKSPYDRTLFLDTDTYVCADISDLFHLLDRYDLAATQAPIAMHGSIAGVPDCFPELNTGLIAYRKSPAVTELLQKWVEFYRRNRAATTHRYCPDQPPFREALYGSDVRVAVLHGEYNCRFIYPVRVQGAVKVLHGRHPDLAAVEAEINQSDRLRVFLPGLGVLTQRERRPLLSLIRQKLQRKFNRS